MARGRVLGKFLAAAAVLPALLAFSTPILAMHCLMADRIMSKCCCPSEAAADGSIAEQGDRGPALAGAGCCQLRRLDARTTESEIAPRVDSPPIASVAVPPPADSTGTAVPAHALEGPRLVRPGPSLVLIKRSLLV